MSEDRAARRAAAFERIVQWGDPVLRSATSDVAVFDDRLRALADEMVALMEDAHGAGLAAPQVGSLQRLLVYRPSEDAPPRVLVNARIAEAGEETAVELEGCLSLGRARVAVEVERALHVVVRAQEVDGTPVELDAEGHHARVLQHEIDHLDGVLMLQRTTPEQRREAVRALREGRAWMPPQADEDEERTDA